MADEVAVSPLSVVVPRTWTLVLELEKKAEDSACVREEYECFLKAVGNEGPVLAGVCAVHSQVVELGAAARNPGRLCFDRTYRRCMARADEGPSWRRGHHHETGNTCRYVDEQAASYHYGDLVSNRWHGAEHEAEHKGCLSSALGIRACFGKHQ